MYTVEKIKNDCHSFKEMLNLIIKEAKIGNSINALSQDLLQDLNEHIQALQVCFSEISVEQEMLILNSSFNKKISSNLFLIDLTKEFDKVFNGKSIQIKKLTFLEDLLEAHGKYIGIFFSSFNQSYLNSSTMDEICNRYEQEKNKVLADSITYA